MRISTIVGVAFGAVMAVVCAESAARTPQQSTQDQSQVATVAQDCLRGFAAPIFDPLRGKLAPRAQDAGGAMLALKDEPAQGERVALLVWVQVVMTCRENVLATAKHVDSPDAVAILDAAWERDIGMLLELYQGMISYGAYSAWQNQAAAQTDAALRSVKLDLQSGTDEGARRAAATVAGQTQLFRDELENYNAMLARQRQATQQRGVALSCSRMGAFTACRP
ncbi:MAG TPA: hypothetical protein VNE59_11825 [Burkholderiales bacterium]|nr:hypothetical protein [Burkholderiales bacterium]